MDIALASARAEGQRCNMHQVGTYGASLSAFRCSRRRRRCCSRTCGCRRPARSAPERCSPPNSQRCWPSRWRRETPAPSLSQTPRRTPPRWPRWTHREAAPPITRRARRGTGSAVRHGERSRCRCETSSRQHPHWARCGNLGSAVARPATARHHPARAAWRRRSSLAARPGRLGRPESAGAARVYRNPQKYACAGHMARREARMAPHRRAGATGLWSRGRRRVRPPAGCPRAPSAGRFGRKMTCCAGSAPRDSRTGGACAGGACDCKHGPRVRRRVCAGRSALREAPRRTPAPRSGAAARLPGQRARGIGGCCAQEALLACVLPVAPQLELKALHGALLACVLPVADRQYLRLKPQIMPTMK